MSTAALFFALCAIEIAGLFAIWFLLKAKIGRYLELESLLSGVREEARALVLELNETADRNVSLVEDRMESLRELLSEVDRRIGVEKREIEARSVEREVYAKLSRRRPIVPSSEGNAVPEPTPKARRASEPAMPASTLAQSSAQPQPRAQPTAPFRPDAPARPSVAVGPDDAPILLSLGAAAEARGSGRAAPEVTLSEDLLLASRTKREEALDLYRQGISAQLIAARLGATVAEIELLVEMEERRAASGVGRGWDAEISGNQAGGEGPS